MRYLLLLWTTTLFAYTPVTVPNGKKLDWKWDGDVKVFHLIAEPVEWQLAPNLNLNGWGYNGVLTGPVIEAVEGDRVRILVTNKLPEPTTVHWHGLILPSGMDGVTGLSQRPIQPGETFQYEFDLVQSGTYMYHPHYDEPTQVAMGMHGVFVIHPEIEEVEVDRDFVIMLSMFAIHPGSRTPMPMSLDFNYFTFNGTVWPITEPLVVKTGEKVRIRYANLSMDSHPIHLHGYEFTVTAKGAKRLKESAQYDVVTVNVPTGNTREIEFVARYPGDWAIHCHKSHHTMNGMVHDISNLITTEIPEETIAKIRKYIPQFMPMGVNGMGMMYDHPHPPIPNLPPYGSPGPFGVIEMSGMFTVLKVRDNIASYTDPGWYDNPPGTMAESVK